LQIALQQILKIFLPLGDWEKNPCLQAKTLVCLRHGELQEIESSHKMMLEYKTLSRAFWGRHIWARGYFVGSSGNVTDEVIIKYIEQQSLEPPDPDHLW